MSPRTAKRTCQHPGCDKPLGPRQAMFCCRKHISRKGGARPPTLFSRNGHRRQRARPEPAAPRACAHHWLIDLANGPTSRGVCILCGATKVFRNSLPNRDVSGRRKCKEERHHTVSQETAPTWR